MSDGRGFLPVFALMFLGMFALGMGIAYGFTAALGLPAQPAIWLGGGLSLAAGIIAFIYFTK